MEAGEEGRRGRECWPSGHNKREDGGRRKCRRRRGVKMKGRGEEINLTLTSAKELEQITPIIQERCVEELFSMTW